MPAVFCSVSGKLQLQSFISLSKAQTKYLFLCRNVTALITLRNNSKKQHPFVGCVLTIEGSGSAIPNHEQHNT